MSRVMPMLRGRLAAPQLVGSVHADWSATSLIPFVATMHTFLPARYAPVDLEQTPTIPRAA